MYSSNELLPYTLLNPYVTQKGSDAAAEHKNFFYASHLQRKLTSAEKYFLFEISIFLPLKKLVYLFSRIMVQLITVVIR